MVRNTRKSQAADDGSGKNPRKVSIGKSVAAAREATGMSQRKVALIVGVSNTTISRLESGNQLPRIDHLATILLTVGLSQARRDEIVAQAEELNAPRWHAVGPVEVEQQMKTLLELEQTATRIVDVSPLLIPGLLQTWRYARAIMLAAEIAEDDVDTKVAVRIGRADAITRPKPAKLVAVIGEACLHQKIADPATMLEQLEWLLTASRRANVALHLLPIGCPWNPALEGPFVLVESEDAVVVHMETRISGTFLHQPVEVAAYRHAATKVLHAVMNQDDTQRVIADAIATLKEQVTAG